MNAKLTFADIVDLFAAKTGQNKKDAEKVLRELLDVMASNICQDGILKLRDFGTFKVVEVSSRESVDVNTGAKIEIASHKKLSFVPDKNLKELVNKPFSLFEPELLKEGVTFDQMELDTLSEEENEDCENEMSDSSVLEDTTQLIDSSDSVEDNPIPVVEETSSSEAVPLDVINEDKNPVAEDIAPRIVEQGKNPVAIEDEKPTAIDTPAKEEPKEAEPELFIWKTAPIDDEIQSNTVKIWWVAIACLIFLILGGFISYIFYGRDNSSPDQLWNSPVATVDSSSAHQLDTASAGIVNEGLDSLESLESVPPAVQHQPRPDTVKKEKPQVAVAKKAETAPKVQQPKTSKGVTEVISGGSTFRTLALKHYGSKEFWVYIYLANKDKVPHPNMLRSGLELLIPNAASLGIDVNDSASIKRAKQLSEKVIRENN